MLEGNNDLTGSIPTELGLAAELKLLEFCSNKISGTIPTYIGQLTKLEQLLICNNKIGGTIPSEIGALVLLEDIDIGKTGFHLSYPCVLFLFCIIVSSMLLASLKLYIPIRIMAFWLYSNMHVICNQRR